MSAVRPERVPAISAGVPFYNERANVGTLLAFLATQDRVTETIAVDDGSTDDSRAIVRSLQDRYDKIALLETGGRKGQLFAWVLAARHATTPFVAFVDADAQPESGAIAVLGDVLQSDPQCVIASGRVCAAGDRDVFPAARFREGVLHRVRAQGFAKEAIIGRFFATRRDWFLDVASRSDIIANDTYFSCLADAAGLRSRYVPQAICWYREAAVTRDFAAQRQRADAGYAQLRAMGVLQKRHEPATADYARALAAQACADPIAALHWFAEQAKSKTMRAYAPPPGDAGAWETQATTKTRLRI